MKTNIFKGAAALLLAICVIGAAACAKGEQKKATESVSLDKTQLTLEIGGEEKLTATVLPADATEKTVTWAVSPAGIVTVTDGTVKAVAEGSATVTASAGGKSASCAVTVKAPAQGTVPTESVSLNKTQLTLEIGGEETLTAAILPADATEKTVEWDVSPAGIVTVTDGTVKAVAEGSATVTASAGGKSASCAVTVKEPARRTVSEEEWYAAMALESVPNLTIRITYTVSEGNETETGYRDLLYDNKKWYYALSENNADGVKELISENYYLITGSKNAETNTYPSDYYYKKGNSWTIQKDYPYAYFDKDGFIAFATGITFSEFRYNEETKQYECAAGTSRMTHGVVNFTDAEAAFENGKLVRVKLFSKASGTLTLEVSDYGTTAVTLPNASEIVS